MDADNVILLARCLSNIAGSVYRFAFGCLGEGRGQRSLSARKYSVLLLLNMHTLICFKTHEETRHRVKFNVYLG